MKPGRKAAVLLIIGGTALGAWSCSTQTPESKEIALAVHSMLMTWWPGYNIEQYQTRVMSACIDWEGSTHRDIEVEKIYPYYTAIYSDAPIFTSELMNASTLACKRERARKNWTCECVEVDKNGDSVLEVPNTFSAKLTGEQRAELFRTTSLAMLINAAWSGDAGKIRSLLDRGVDVNAFSAGGTTALMYAAAKGRVSAVKALLAGGADVKLQSNEGKTALTYATEYGHDPVAELLRAAGAK